MPLFNPQIQFTNNVAYTPTLTGLGTCTSIDFFWCRMGDSVQVYGSFVTGTTTAVEARISLPSGLTSDTAKIPSLKACGYLASGGNLAGTYVMLMEPTITYATLGVGTAGTGAFNKALGSTALPATTAVGVFFTIPIAGW